MSKTNTDNGQDSARFEKARGETIKYHEEYYSKHDLFEAGSWLEKADAHVLLLSDWLAARPRPRALDIGCGVGRNSIPLARAVKDVPDAQIDCLDVLNLAIEKLQRNAVEHGVAHVVSAHRLDMELLEFPREHYDLILAISVLEHCSSVRAIESVLDLLVEGTKPGGINRLEFTTDRNVRDKATGEPVPTFVETPLDSATLLDMLARKYAGWAVQLQTMDPYREELVRDGKQIIWQSNQLNFIAEKTAN